MKNSLKLVCTTEPITVTSELMDRTKNAVIAAMNWMSMFLDFFQKWKKSGKEFIKPPKKIAVGVKLKANFYEVIGKPELQEIIDFIKQKKEILPNEHGLALAAYAMLQPLEKLIGENFQLIGVDEVKKLYPIEKGENGPDSYLVSIFTDNETEPVFGWFRWNGKEHPKKYYVLSFSK